MKISVTPITSLERNGLFEKLRLKRPSMRYTARITLALDAADAPQLAALDMGVLKTWAGPALADLVAEIERAGRSPSLAAQVTISTPLACPDDAEPLRLRAAVFSELVRFSLAERRLARVIRAGATD